MIFDIFSFSLLLTVVYWCFFSGCFVDFHAVCQVFYKFQLFIVAFDHVSHTYEVHRFSLIFAGFMEFCWFLLGFEEFCLFSVAFINFSYVWSNFNALWVFIDLCWKFVKLIGCSWLSKIFWCLQILFFELFCQFLLKLGELHRLSEDFHGFFWFFTESHSRVHAANTCHHFLAWMHPGHGSLSTSYPLQIGTLVAQTCTM